MSLAVDLAPAQRFLGGGASGERMRAHDWAGNALGLPAGWPQPLMTLVDVMLASSHPMYIAWGADRTLLYNDAYAVLLGDKHPAALGGPLLDVWAEIRDTLGALCDTVLGGEPVHMSDITFQLQRHGPVEEAHFAFSLTPVRDAGGAIAGLFCVCTETTDQVLAERRQADETARQRSLFARAPGFITILRGPEHVYEFVNDAYLAVFGGRDFIGKPIRDVFPELVDQGFYEWLDQAYATGQRFVAKDVPIRVHRPESTAAEDRFLDFIYEPMIDGAGQVTGIFCEGHDVTQAHAAHQALQRLNADLERQVSERTHQVGRTWQVNPDMLAVLNPKGLFERSNPAWQTVLGWPEVTIASTPFLEFVHPDDRERSREAFVDALSDGHDALHFENRYRHQQGGYRWLSWLTVLEDGKLYCSARDITADKAQAAELAARTDELEATAARLRAIFETSYQFLGLLAPDGMVLDANASSLAAIGVPLEAVMGLPYQDTPWFGATDGAAALVKAAVAQAAGGTPVRHELELQMPTGPRVYDFAIRPVRDLAGEVIALLPEAMDITEQRQAAEQLRQAQKIEAVGQLTGGVAHDFNNLLMVLSSGLELIGRQRDPARLARTLAAMRQAVERGAGLTRQLLAFSRRQSLRPEPVDLARKLGGMHEMLDRSLRGDVQVDMDFADGLWPVEVDPGELELVVLNLAVNARDAMPGGGTIVLQAENLADLALAAGRGDFVKLSVIDTGTGMSPEVLARAFEPFFTTKDVGKGSGLGLAQTHGFAHASGGMARIESRAGAGTTVSLYLPRTHKQPAAVSRAAPAEGGDMPTFAGQVLLVEDDDEVAALTAEMLRQLGYEVTRVADAEAALGALADGRPVDLLLSDVMMPGALNGVALAHEVRRRRPELPVVLASGYADSVRKETAEANIRLLSKPYRLEELAEALAQVRGGAAAA